MNKILGKFIIILCVLLCGAQSVGAAAEQSFDVAAEEATPSSVVVPRQSTQEIIPEFLNRSDGVIVIKWLRMLEIMSIDGYESKTTSPFIINFSEEAFRPVHLLQILKIFKYNPFLRGLDFISPETEIDFYQPDIIGLRSFLKKRRGMPFEFRIRHHSRRPFPSFSTPEESPNALISTVLRELTVNPDFSIMIEEAPDDIRLALFRARCSTVHGRESLKREIASKQETINARAEFFRHHRPVRKLSDAGCTDESSDPDETIRQEDGREEWSDSSDTADFRD